MRPGWYNENTYRDYPFISGSVCSDLPDSAIVDFGAIMYNEALYDPTEHTVYLASISRSGSTVHYTFKTTAPGAADCPLIFTRNVADDDFIIEYVDLCDTPAATSSSSAAAEDDDDHNVDYDLPPVGPICDDTPPWDGFMVHGEMAAIAEIVSDGETLEFDPDCWVIEPGRIQNLSHPFVSSISLANVDRVRTTPPEECSVSGDDAGLVYINEICMLGDIKVKPGFNIAIRQDNVANALVISPIVGEGEGEPCEEIQVFARETAPDSSGLLSGGPACSELIRAINGIPGPVVRLLADPGVSIYPHETDAYTIVIDVTNAGLNICQSSDGD